MLRLIGFLFTILLRSKTKNFPRGPVIHPQSPSTVYNYGLTSRETKFDFRKILKSSLKQQHNLKMIDKRFRSLEIKDLRHLHLV